MKKLTEEFKQTIRPFFYSEYNGSYSALLNAGTYRDEFLMQYGEEKGFEGGGYSWDAIADLFIREQLPHYIDELKHDSEADMFCLYSKNERAIYDFLDAFKHHCDDDAKFIDLIERADFAQWD